MRIVGHIDHPVLKITIFQHAGKFAVKFETDLMEQTYKFRIGDELQSVNDIKSLVDAQFIGSVLGELSSMNLIKHSALGRYLSYEEDDFDDIL